MTATADATTSVLETMAGHVSTDAVLTHLQAGRLQVGLGPLIPSGVDCVAAVVARSVATDERHPAVAFALPRGRHPLAAFLALYFSLGRRGFGGRSNYLRLPGSVALSTRDRELREIVSRLAPTGAWPPHSALSIVRLVQGRPDINGHKAPAAASLDSSQQLGGVSPADKHLLLHLPWFRPEVSLNSISVSVVDATATSPDAWPMTFSWNESARRRQVWVGELGNSNFAEFCQERDIPLWRFDWDIIRAARTLWGEGSSQLSTRALVRRDGAPTFELRPVEDGEVDDELAMLERHFASLYRKSKNLDADAPPVVRTARQLFYLLGRVIAPLHVYDATALTTPQTMRAATALRRVREASPAQWFGPWRRLDQEWAGIRGGLTAVYERLLAEDPKYWDLLALLDLERNQRQYEHIVVRCTTKVEARALSAALLADGMATPEELDVDGRIAIRWFGASSPPLPSGPESGRYLTVLSEPPSPFRAGPYLASETGHFQVLLYPVQRRRFHRLAESASVTCSGTRSNLAMLRELHFPANGQHGLYPVSGPTIRDAPAFQIHGRRTPKAENLDEGVDRMRCHWDEFIGLGSDRDPTASDEPVLDGALAASAGAQPTSAVLVVCETGEHVLLPAEGKVDVVLGDERLMARPVKDVLPGQHIVLMEGMERGSALTELFDAWEESFGPGQVYGELYRRALDAAIDKAGGSDAKLAEIIGVHPTTVRFWRQGLTLAPGNDKHLKLLIAFSGVQPAMNNYAAIRLYIRRVRGKHGSLGRIFKRAVSETVVDPGGPEQQRLEAETGLDLTPILSSVRRLTVQHVDATPRQVPRSLLGRFLTAENPALKGTA